MNFEIFPFFFSGVGNVCFKNRHQTVYAGNLATSDLGELDQEPKILGAMLNSC